MYTNDRSDLWTMVLVTGLEPVILTELDPKSSAFA